MNAAIKESLFYTSHMNSELRLLGAAEQSIRWPFPARNAGQKSTPQKHRAPPQLQPFGSLNQAEDVCPTNRSSSLPHFIQTMFLLCMVQVHNNLYLFADCQVAASMWHEYSPCFNIPFVRSPGLCIVCACQPSQSNVQSQNLKDHGDDAPLNPHAPWQTNGTQLITSDGITSLGSSHNEIVIDISHRVYSNKDSII